MIRYQGGNIPKSKEVMKLAYDLYTPRNRTENNLPPVILIHCLVETRKTWLEIAPKIAENTGRKVYAIDCRNHGGSPRTDPDGHGSEICATDLGEFLAQNGIEKAIIVGHSLGGVIAMQFALNEPTKVEKLVVEDSLAKKSKHTTGNFVPAALNFVKEAYENQPAEGGEEGVYEYVRHYFNQLAPMLRLPPDLFDHYDKEKLPLRWNGSKLELEFNLDAVLNIVKNDKLVKELNGSFNGDTLFIYGKESQFRVDQDRLVSKHFPQALKVGFDKAGHFIHHVYPHEFAEEVINFINFSTKSKL